MRLLVLLFAHLLADYPLQGDFISKMKGSNLLLTHCGIWTGCICVAAHLMGIPITGDLIMFLFSIHAGADYFKANGGYGNADPLGWPLWVDQTIHALQCLAVLFWN